MHTDAALALAALATAILGDVYVANIDYRYGTLPTFSVVDPFGAFAEQGETAAEVEAAIIETVEFYEAVAADPAPYHADTVAEADRVLAAFAAA